jgi:hypothetical protein
MTPRIIILTTIIFIIINLTICESCYTDNTDTYYESVFHCNYTYKCNINFCDCLNIFDTPTCEISDYFNKETLQICFTEKINCYNNIHKLFSDDIDSEYCTREKNKFILQLLQIEVFNEDNTYNTSDLYNSCKFEVCKLNNKTNSNFMPWELCESPFGINIMLILSGSDWRLFLQNNNRQIRTAIHSDLKFLMGTSVFISELKSGSLYIKFTFPFNNTILVNSLIETGTQNNDWLYETSKIYSLLGGTDSIFVSSFNILQEISPSNLPENTNIVNNTNNTNDTKCNTGCIIGIVMASVFGFAVLGLVLFLFFKNSKKKQELEKKQSEPYDRTKINKV